MTFLLELTNGTHRAIDAVLFDMDGTIVDSIAATERCWSEWARSHGVLDRLTIDHGRPAEYTMLAMMPELTDEQLAEQLIEQRHREATDLEGVAPIVGTLELLEWLDLHTIPWGVVTSADRTLALARMGVCGIDPPMLVTREDVHAGKPDPEPFLLGAQLLGVAPERCLVAEDSLPGLASGRAAGAVTAGVGGHDGDISVRNMADLHTRLAHARP